MTSNTTWVCFDCRQAVRRAKYERPFPRCPKCAGQCVHVGDKAPVPTKTDLQGWQALRDAVSTSRIQWQVDQYKRRIRRRHDIEQEIVKLESRPKNKGRDGAIQLLRQELAKL